MAMDSMQKRMSAINPASPWRGAMVDATEASFSVGNRQAADFMYSGISSEVVATGWGRLLSCDRNRLVRTSQ